MSVTDRTGEPKDVAPEVAELDDAEEAVLEEDGVVATVVEERDAPPKKVRVRKRRKRRVVKRATIWLHRWASLALGIVLLLITTTGASALYAPDWTRWTNGSVYDVRTTDDPISYQQAIDAVSRAHPDFQAGAVIDERGLFKVQSADYEGHPGFYGVDPSDGRITGYVNENQGFMALMLQIHECFFTCDTYPAYISWTNAAVPSWMTVLGEDLTWGTLVLASFGVMLLFLALSGLWLWWPGIRRWTHGFRVRTGKGRYARDYDLHQLVGLVAVPFLFMWGLTGGNFYFPWVGKAWYAVTGGHAEKEEDPFTSVEAKTPDIGLDAAEAAAQRVAGPGSPLVYGALPAKDDPTGAYYFYFAKGTDGYEYGAFPGNYGVSVDRHDAARTDVDDFATADTVSNRLLDVWGAPTFHFGYQVNGWWRMIWFAFGITPLFLAWTGVSTWLAKRAVRKRRKDLTGEKGPMISRFRRKAEVPA